MDHKPLTIAEQMKLLETLEDTDRRTPIGPIWESKTKKDKELIQKLKGYGFTHPILTSVDAADKISLKQRQALQSMLSQLEQSLLSSRRPRIQHHAFYEGDGGWDEVYYDMLPGDFGEPNV